MSPDDRSIGEAAPSGQASNTQVIGTTSLYENGQIRLIPVS
jgi:hypothetical protein